MEDLEQGEGERGMDRRRSFGAIAGLVATAAGLSAEACKNPEPPPGRKKEKPKPKEKTKAESQSGLPEIPKNPQVYDTGPLAGKRFSDLYAYYLGKEGKLPEKASIDFPNQLRLMWEEKIRHSGKNNVVQETGKQLVTEYATEHKEPRTLKTYGIEMDVIIKRVQDNIDWREVGKLKHLDPDEVAVCKAVADVIGHKDIMAYSLTELMPSIGKVNIEVLQFLLQNAGRRYIESIPALFDAKTSFGPYQFTEYALYDTGAERRGASIINRALPAAERIPGSVSRLRGNDHHKAAYLFMVDNFCNLVRRAVKEEEKKKKRKGKHATSGPLSVLRNLTPDDKDQLVTFAATAHHMPYPALDAAMRWLAGRANTKPGGKKLPYMQSCGPHLLKYARKTNGNIEALKAYAF